MRALIVKMSSLGDILQSIPAAKALSIDGFTVDWVIEERCKELLQDRPFVETIHSIDTKRNSSKVDQSDNIVGGDMAGGNILKKD